MLESRGLNMKAFFKEFMSAARQAPRLYFAPLFGAMNQVRAELKRLDRR